MLKILVNDGIEDIGRRMMEEAGFHVDMNKIPQEELIHRLPDYAGICVRSATKVRKDLIDACPNLRFIARGGVGLDNIDVDYARSKGIAVINTPAASSRSVAELAMAHLLTCVRFLYDANRRMPAEGEEAFASLKKKYAGGSEVEGKKLGVIGMGRIGQEMMRLGLGCGMEVLAHDPFVDGVEVSVGAPAHDFTLRLDSLSLEEVLSESDFISLHLPSIGKALISADEIAQMKDGVVLINAARGGLIDESALLAGLESGKISAAGLDVFDNEPKPSKEILSHPRISLTPHIGASTVEAQEKIGIDLAKQVIQALS